MKINSENKIEINSCSAAYTIKILGGKWKAVILFLISVNINRFGIMLKTMKNVSKHILTKQLRELESEKVIKRIVYPEVPPRVEYFLTKKGESIIPLIRDIEEWGNNNKN